MSAQEAVLEGIRKAFGSEADKTSVASKCRGEVLCMLLAQLVFHHDFLEEKCGRDSALYKKIDLYQ